MVNVLTKHIQILNKVLICRRFYIGKNNKEELIVIEEEEKAKVTLK